MLNIKYGTNRHINSFTGNLDFELIIVLDRIGQPPEFVDKL